MVVIVPFRAGGKSRLPGSVRDEVAHAMLEDVLAVVAEYADTLLVSSDAGAATIAAGLGVRVIDDPGGGQGPAVARGLDGVAGAALVVNADCPCVAPPDLAALAGAALRGRVALVEARDGTTNALALPKPQAFRPAYGAGSASRFREHARRLGLGVDDLELPNLADDVDTLEDLERIADRVGPRTREQLAVIAR
jgi:2-phospho-L-lactate guanylyltransferase